MPHKVLILLYCLLAFAVAVPIRAGHGQANRATSLTSPAQDKSTQPEAERIYGGKEVDKKPVIKRKPQPEYTREAQDHGQGGQVVLRCVFSAIGQVTNIHVVVEPNPPYGLTQAAVNAASRIKFTPAMKDGKPVSMWMELQYRFHR